MNKPFFILPESIIINGSEYKIRTDFRVWIEILQILSDEAVTDKRKVCCLTAKAFVSDIPKDLHIACDRLLDFMMMGQKPKKCKKTNEEIISFSHDEGLIYAAFLEQYSIDLYEVNMHWWKFLNLFYALNENTRIMKIAGYRGVDLAKIKNPEAKRFLRRMKNIYRIKKPVCDGDIANVLDSMVKEAINE